MKTKSNRVRFRGNRSALALLTCVLIAPLVSPSLIAQRLPTAPDSKPGSSAAAGKSDDQTVQLDAFDVRADSDKSYGALNSNSITRFNTELDQMPVSADVFNQAFMKDIAASSVEDMIMTYSAGAGSAVASPGPSASSNQSGDRNANSFLSLRGLTAPTMQRDGFMPVNTYIQSGSTGTGFTSNFDIERVEVINGPQALLYGVGGAGGVMNLTAKQAYFGKAAATSVQYQVDQYGNKLGLLDYGMGNDQMAVRIAATQQQAQAGRRLWVGGPMSGLYGQLAFKLPGHTTVRISGEQTEYNRIAGTTNQTYTAVSTATDARNGQRLRYLLATNQIQSAANGGASGGGVIGNGQITWDNVDSYGTFWNTNEYTKTQIATMTADTQWNSWLTTQLALGYRETYDDRVGNTITYAAPNLATNPTGGWGVGMTGGMPFSDLAQPVKQKGIRFSALATNELFGGRAHSQSIVGADFFRTDGVLITYAYVKADSNYLPITTGTTTPTGYTYASPVWWNVNGGPMRYPFWTPRRISTATYAGQNYVRVQTNPPQKSLITPTNPEGLLVGGATTLGDYRAGKTLNKGIYAANYTQLLDRKLTLLFGARVGDSYSVQATEAAAPSPPSTSAFLDTKTVSFNVGANYALLPWLRPYFSVSDSYDPPPIFVAGPLGDYPRAAHGVGEEVGIKVTNAQKTISGSLAVYHANSKNEEASLTSTLLFDINPSGLNGFYSAPSVWTNVDREARGVQLAVTATPISNWRMRVSAALTDGTINSDKSFAQLYNDQFYANASGQVTYRDGTVVFVNPTANATPVASTAAGAIPLTLAKMSTSTDGYYANPLAVTGAINRSSVVGRLLTTVDATHGPILTGATGLPISALQINPGFTPPGTIVTNVAGEKSVGYPKYSFVLTNNYTFTTGWLKGLSVGGTASAGWKYRQYYYYPNGLTNPNAARSLFYWPTQLRFDGLIGYTRRISQHYTLSTQVNVSNMLNHYHVLILPNFTAGYSGVDDATFDQQPRSYVWSTTLSF